MLPSVPTCAPVLASRRGFKSRAKERGKSQADENAAGGSLADLTGNQLEIFADQLAPVLDYFRRLEERMVEQGFDESERLRYLVPEARKAARESRPGAFDDCAVRWPGAAAAWEAQAEARAALSWDTPTNGWTVLVAHVKPQNHRRPLDTPSRRHAFWDCSRHLRAFFIARLTRQVQQRGFSLSTQSSQDGFALIGQQY